MNKTFVFSCEDRRSNCCASAALCACAKHFSAAHAQSTDSRLSFFQGNKFQGLSVRKTSSLGGNENLKKLGGKSSLKREKFQKIVARCVERRQLLAMKR